MAEHSLHSVDVSLTPNQSHSNESFDIPPIAQYDTPIEQQTKPAFRIVVTTGDHKADKEIIQTAKDEIEQEKKIIEEQQAQLHDFDLFIENHNHNNLPEQTPPPYIVDNLIHLDDDHNLQQNIQSTDIIGTNIHDSINNRWQQLKQPPFNGECARSPVLLSDDKILLSPCYDSYLHKFDSVSVKWSKFEWKYNGFENHVCCLSNDKSKLIVFEGFDKVLIIVDVNTMKVISNFGNLFKTNQDPSIIADPYNDNMVHIIGGYACNEHRTVNFMTGEVVIAHSFSHDYKYDFEGAGIVYIEHQECFLWFNAGIAMFKYNLKKQLWSELRVIMPGQATNFGYIMTHDEKYIVIFGGCYWNKDRREWITSDNILIFDIEKMEWIISDIKLPKNVSKRVVMNGVLTSDNMVYLFTKGERHWKMNLDLIIKASDGLISGYLKENKIDIPFDVTSEIVRFHGSIIV